MKKSEAQKQMDSLQKEMDRLKEIINRPKNLFETITSYKDVCIELGEPEETCPYKKIKQIEKLFNRDWVKDWSNKNQKKYYPYFEHLTGSGWVFRASSYRCYFSDGQVAFYKNEETSDFCGRTFTKEYSELM